MTSEKIKRIAIVQLDRAEQTLASLPAIDGVLRANPNAEFTFFLSSDVHALAASFGFGKVVLIPRHAKDIEQVLSDYPQEFDELINLSKTAEGLVLASGLYARKRTGLYLDGENGLIEGSDAWCAYLEGVVGKTTFNPFHISDVYARTAKVSECGFEYKLYGFDFSLETNPLVIEFAQKSTVRIAISVSCLSGISGAQLVKNLLQSFGNVEVALVGTLRSRPLAQEILAINRHNKDRIIDFTGQTSIEDLMHLARFSDICICKPGIFSQLSAGYGTFTICLNPHEANLLETAPYGHGHLVLENLAVGNDSGVASCAQLCVEFVLGAGSAEIPSQEKWKLFFDGLIDQYIGDVRAFLCQRSASASQNNRELVELRLFPLLFQGYTYDETLRSFYRLLWNLELDNRGDLVEHLEVLSQDAIPCLTRLLKPLEQLGELASFGIRYSNHILNAVTKNDIPAARECANSLQEVDDSITLLSTTYRELLPLRNIFSLQQQHMVDDDPKKSAKAMENCYRQLQERILILLELINSLFQQESAQAKEYENG